MKKKKPFKYRPIYFFIIILSIIGLTTGCKYYKSLSNELKSSITTEINLQKSLERRTNNLPKRVKQVTKIFVYSILIIPLFLNVFEIFMSSFSLGIMLSVLAQYKLKFKLIYLLFYNFIPLLLTLILIRVSFTTTKYLLKYLFNKKDPINKKHLVRICQKYLLISLFFFLYEFVILIYSPTLNNYLLSII